MTTSSNNLPRATYNAVKQQGLQLNQFTEGFDKLSQILERHEEAINSLRATQENLVLHLRAVKAVSAFDRYGADKDYFTFAEAAQILQISEQTLRRSEQERRRRGAFTLSEVNRSCKTSNMYVFRRAVLEEAVRVMEDHNISNRAEITRILDPEPPVRRGRPRKNPHQPKPTKPQKITLPKLK